MRAVTILAVRANAHRRAFEVRLRSGTFLYPFAKADPAPTSANPVLHVAADPELGRQGFTYGLRSGAVGSVLVDQVLDYNKDPSYLRDALLYGLTVEAQQRLALSPLSRRELIRRLDTSPAQLYRLLDQTNYRKSVDQLLRLLAVLECEVEILVRANVA